MDQQTLALTQVSLPPNRAILPAQPDPVEAAHAAEINAWVEADQRAYLVEFYTAIEQMPLDVVVSAIRTACARGYGIWMEPPEQTATAPRPATHMIEMALFGAVGYGATLIEAARSWRNAARHLLESELAEQGQAQFK